MEKQETEIIVLRLSSGEEIMDEQPKSFEGTVLTLKNPIMIIPQPTPDGQMKISLINYGHNYVKDIKVLPEHIVWFGTPDENLKANYKQVTSPIQLPDEKTIQLHPNE